MRSGILWRTCARLRTVIGNWWEKLFDSRVKIGNGRARSYSQLGNLSNDSIETFAFDQLHRKKEPSIFFSDFIQRDDIGMMHLRDRFAFADKALYRLPILRH